MDSNIQKLLARIEQKLGWGTSDDWQGRDFEKLNELILEQTKSNISDSTLKRIWGKVAYQSTPSTHTLDALARFAGFENWRAFVSIEAKIPGKPIRDKVHFSRYRSILLLCLLFVAVVVVIYILPTEKILSSSDSKYEFTGKYLSHTVPSAVIFNYDVTAADDSVFIQHAWDKSKKVAIDKNEHVFTLTHYEPGFYHPQLVVGKEIVKTHDIMISTKGWLGWISNGPIPVYLDSASFILPDHLELPVGELLEKVPGSEITPPYVRYYNVGNFGSVRLSDFRFSAQVKSGYKSGAATCQFISIQLITDGAHIWIPLSSKGCVSELTLSNFDQEMSGKNVDLSNFGTDPSSWISISCRNDGKVIQYFVDDQLAFEGSLPLVETKIVGIGFSFQGTGAVRKIEITDGARMAFKQF